jgi:beta-glucuronidase
MRYLTIILILLLSLSSNAQRAITSLNGQWLFAVDPLNTGIQNGWYKKTFPGNFLDKVTVPHCFSEDGRYYNYTGAAWYFKNFKRPVLKEGYRAYLVFQAAFYKTTIWINEQKAGEHEGGYTPFEIDVTDYLQADNSLAVQVNNSWDTTTLPGAKTVDATYRPNASQLYAWMNYGGLIRPVQLVVRPSVFISNIRVIPFIDWKTKNVRLQLKAAVVNTLSTPVSKTLRVVYSSHNNERLPALSERIQLQPGVSQDVFMDAQVKLDAVKLWDINEPFLYNASVVMEDDTLRTQFGIRSIEVAQSKLLLNRKAIRLGGGNRPTDYPGVGSVDPDSVVIKDLRLMKEAGMEFSRISHHAASVNVLNWADQNGMLIIAEGGNWQLTTKQMNDESIRSKYRQQAEEMIKRDWNHPCIIAYSLGNEFYSQTDAGKAWVRDMKAFTKQLDSSRLITFASYIVWRDYIKKPEDEASQYVDFISTNIYGKHLENLNHIHELYPDKPVFISEFGIRNTANKTEEDRINYFRSAIKAIRQCDFVVGASVWSFNDYKSRYPDTDADGYRRWGLVNEYRLPYASYYYCQKEFTPVVIDTVIIKGLILNVKMTARNDFPSYTIKGWILRSGDRNVLLPEMKPGASVTLNIAPSEEVRLEKAGGFVVERKRINSWKPSNN